MYGCRPNYLFGIKCAFKDNPLLLISIIFIISVVISACGLVICESPLKLIIDNDPINFDSLENSIWCVIITMTTVGYGDFYPRTFIGRLLDIFVVIWGIFIVSMFVVVLTSTLKLTSS